VYQCNKDYHYHCTCLNFFVILFGPRMPQSPLWPRSYAGSYNQRARASATVEIKRDAAATDERIWRAADAEKIQRLVVAVQRPAAPDYTVASHDQNFLMHRVKWRHSNLWSRFDLYVVGQRGILWKLSGRFVALFSNKTEPAGLRKRPYYQKCPYYQVMSQEQTFLGACPHHGGKQLA